MFSATSSVPTPVKKYGSLATPSDSCPKPFDIRPTVSSPPDQPRFGQKTNITGKRHDQETHKSSEEVEESVEALAQTYNEVLPHMPSLPLRQELVNIIEHDDYTPTLNPPAPSVETRSVSRQRRCSMALSPEPE